MKPSLPFAISVADLLVGLVSVYLFACLQVVGLVTKASTFCMLIGVHDVCTYTQNNIDATNINKMLPNVQ